MTPDQLLGAILDEIGEEVEDSTITKAIRSLDLWCNDEKTKIGLPYFRWLSEQIATELLRIRDAESDFKYDGWEDRIKELEQEQGWEFTDEQMNGIKMGLENNVLLIHAGAGCGKTSLVSGILAAQVKKVLRFIDCWAILKGMIVIRVLCTIKINSWDMIFIF